MSTQVTAFNPAYSGLSRMPTTTGFPEFDNLFNQAMQGFGFGQGQGIGMGFGRGQLGLTAELKESNDCYCYKVDVPGVKKEATKISYDQSSNTLTVTAEHPGEQAGDKERCLWSDRCYGYKTRTFRVPDNADPSKIQAHQDCGVLTINVPKLAGKQQQQIKIQ